MTMMKQMSGCPTSDTDLHEGHHMIRGLTIRAIYHHVLYVSSLLLLGTPITQNIIDTATLVSAFGQGLQTAEKGQTAKFMIETSGKRGNIEVHVKGMSAVSSVIMEYVLLMRTGCVMNGSRLNN